ncbi:hypothetical protein HPG69_011547 [Diceros bicornis minor]|uniref:Uncharacterized protein n=1 Tax=Diceros bicornis minor TaxID=77932 RepID=A0A7J7EJC9_DICBM|nr:hypothetical protein HPG69_011547 [Diceros bicornis minor]
MTEAQVLCVQLETSVSNPSPEEPWTPESQASARVGTTPYPSRENRGPRETQSSRGSQRWGCCAEAVPDQRASTLLRFGGQEGHFRGEPTEALTSQTYLQDLSQQGSVWIYRATISILSTSCSCQHRHQLLPHLELLDPPGFLGMKGPDKNVLQGC